MNKININPQPTYPKPPVPPAPHKVDKGYEGMSNAEVYGALALILIELQKINERLDVVVNSEIVAKEPDKPVDLVAVLKRCKTVAY